MDPRTRDGELIPAAHDPRFERVFAWYTRRLVRRSWHALRLERSGLDLARELNTIDGPLILLTNHIGWWDPLIVFELRRMFWSQRRGIAPMDAAQLRRFRFMRKIGIFGIDPDDSSSMPPMLSYIAGFFASHDRPTLCITPQGRFADPRESIQLRPSAAAVAAATPGITLAALSIEYAFWQDRKPEALLRLVRVPTPKVPSTSGWLRAMSSAMQANAQALSALVIARDESSFELLTGSGSSINPIYDLILRLRSRHGPIPSHRNAHPPPHLPRSA